jgi:hypothetical protein
MTLVGTKSGSFQIYSNCGGVSGSKSLLSAGTANPVFGITAPAAIAGTITSGTITVASTTFAGTEKVALYWVIGGVAYYRYDCTISSGTGTTFGITDGAGDALPTGGQAVLIATRQDITDGVSINGNNIQQLIAKSSEIGLVEWLTVTPAQERLSVITEANDFDAWPTTSAQVAPPTAWTAAAVVVTLRCYNFSVNTATMEVSVILA